MAFWTATIKINFCLGRNILLARKVTLFLWWAQPHSPFLLLAKECFMCSLVVKNKVLWIYLGIFWVFAPIKKVKFTWIASAAAINLSSFILACFKLNSRSTPRWKLSYECQLCTLRLEGSYGALALLPRHDNKWLRMFRENQLDVNLKMMKWIHPSIGA